MILIIMDCMNISGQMFLPVKLLGKINSASNRLLEKKWKYIAKQKN